MKIFHFILGKADKNRANGVNQVIAGLGKYTSRLGATVSVLGKAQTAAREGEVIERDGFSVTIYTKWSRAFRAAVYEAIDAADVVHLHGTYSPLNIWIGMVCEARQKPYIVTLHSGLSPARISLKNRAQKWLFHILFQKRHLEKAALIHALTEEETTDAFEQFRPRSICVIPNGVDLEDFLEVPKKESFKSGVTFGYIGRLSREKNLAALCEAFCNVNIDGSMRLLLAGPRSREGEELARIYGKSGVKLVGPKFGKDKMAFLDDIDLFIHPSKSDVFSIGAMEALARGVPMVISRTSDTSHFAETGAFVLCEPTSFGIERGLRKALNNREDWTKMACRGRQLIKTRLNWEVIATDLIEAYKRVGRL